MIEWASAGRPIGGEAESGDRFLVEEHPEGALFAVIDGLGHGPLAAEAAAQAQVALKGGFGRPTAELLERCAARLKKTRGAVVSVGEIFDREGRLEWGGLGNVEGTLFRAAGGREPLMVSPGILGGPAARPASRKIALAPGDLVVLHTDGIRGGWAAGLQRTQAVQELVWQVLRTSARPTDDALVLAVRWRGAG